jgi:ADP-ribose pyrophosphatase
MVRRHNDNVHEQEPREDGERVMFTVIIGDGLSKAALSPEACFQASRANIAQHEIDRLMGKGRTFGRGPLAEFLRQAVEAQQRGANTGVLLLQDEESVDVDASPTASERGDTAFIEPLADIAARVDVIRTTPLEVPWDRLRESIARLAGGKVPGADISSSPIRFLIVGSETERRITAIATLLRIGLGYREVAICPHLVGSGTQEAHFSALRHNLPSAGVEILLDLEQAAEYAGLERAVFRTFGCRPCAIHPPEARDALGEERRRIVELLCMHWTKVHLKPLMGGYSGSLLFIADGWKGGARTEPLVVKVDGFEQMRRETGGYHQVKDFFGKHVPTFGQPVTRGDFTGVAMELAAMEGRPETLQDSFEAAENEVMLGRFLSRLDKALGLISDKLHNNTAERRWVVPYRAFELHADVQLRYLQRNVGWLLEDLQSDGGVAVATDPAEIEMILRLIRSNEDGVESEVCQVHGDLNFQNIICDEVDNIWFIDWTHSSSLPVEKDYAKLENDVKFVMSKEFDLEDLPRLKAFEEYLLTHRVPAEAGSLPDSLKFAKWDLRYRKILESVRRIRHACFSIKRDDEWIVYRIALLRYAMHNLSFSKRRGRGECDLPQLAYALSSVEAHVFNLVADDFHLKIRAEKPMDYPPRLRISIDEAPWGTPCSAYEPPYFVAPTVLANDRDANPDGWADPEDFSKVRDEYAKIEAKFRDAEGRPLNPRGRTGVAGRGLLARWGPNPAVAAVITGPAGDSENTDILLGSAEGSMDLRLPKGFVLPGESLEQSVERVVATGTGWRPDLRAAEMIVDGYAYDSRQTDHAWVELRAYHLYLDKGTAAELELDPGGDLDEVGWYPLTAETVNRVPSNQARLIREAVTRLQKSGRMEERTANALLSATG